MIETNRLKICAASQEKMEAFIEAETDLIIRLQKTLEKCGFTLNGIIGED